MEGAHLIESAVRLFQNVGLVSSYRLSRLETCSKLAAIFLENGALNAIIDLKTLF